MNAILHAMEDMLDAPGQTIGRAFAQIEAAEEAIQAFIEAHPDYAEQLDAAFMLCQSPFVSTDLPVTLFAAHCRMLLGYIVQGIDLDRPTLVEVAVMTCKVSETAPPDTTLTLMVLSDQETMAAFGQEATSAPEKIGDHLWPTLTTACRRAYKDAFGKPRSKLYQGYLRKHRERRERERALAAADEAKTEAQVWPVAAEAPAAGQLAFALE